jgi:hypothetical protein
MRDFRKRPATRAQRKEYRDKNKARARDVWNRWLAANIEHKREWLRNWSKERMRSDPCFRMRRSLATRIKNAITKPGAKKSMSTVSLLGCREDFARVHIESQFLAGMKWGNYGIHGWHIDHIIPCAAFDLSDEDHQKMCFHYTNLRPMWARDNILKGDKITPEAIALIITSSESVETDGPFYIEGNEGHGF